MASVSADKTEGLFSFLGTAIRQGCSVTAAQRNGQAYLARMFHALEFCLACGMEGTKA
jgi:hypothetical protein